MISRSDILLLAAEYPDIDVSSVYKTQDIPIDVLKQINDKRPLELISFYEKLRRSYNQKRSKLYINIMKFNDNAVEDSTTILTTLSAMLNQILQYKCENKPMFYKHARADEITRVLEIYFKTYDILPARELLSLIRADIYALEVISGRK